MSPHLSFDIQLEIIKRLPVKSLIRFRSVCKAWKSLIDNSPFIAGYNDRHDLPEHLVVRYTVRRNEEEIEVKYVSFVDDDNTFPNQKFSLTIPHFLQNKVVIGSSHGLLFLIGYFREQEDSVTQMVVLWNPAIRKSIAVALPNRSLVHDSFNFVVGFGVCPDTQDPKLVKITNIDYYRDIESICRQVMVFTLSSGEWTCLCSSNLPRKSIEFTWGQTVVGQFIYWLAHDRIVEDGRIRHRNLIMSFDLSTQEFREVDLPDSLANSSLSVARLRESLGVVKYSYVGYSTDSWKRVCDVWKMEDGDSKAFTKLFTIDLPNASVFRTLGFRKSGDPIVEIRDENKDNRAIVVYEPCSEHIKDLEIYGYEHQRFSYTESLLLLDHDDGHIIRCGSGTCGAVTFGLGN